MLLGPVTAPDLVVYIVFLTWELLVQVGFFAAAAEGLAAIPFLVTQLPYQLLQDRYLTPPKQRLAWTNRSTLFQDAIVKCVRYAFANMDPRVARVFLSKGVALPFLKFRLWRHGALGVRDSQDGLIRSPSGPVSGSTRTAKWVEIDEESFHGILIQTSTHNLPNSSSPDILLYYLHGGGFSLGSTHFYLEFLLGLHTQLLLAGFKTPAILALEYTLVPDSVYPTQLNEVIRGYEYALSLSVPEKICLAGDSAGGTLALSFLLWLAREDGIQISTDMSIPTITFTAKSYPKPRMACLLSPWPTLLTPNPQTETPTDILTPTQLNHFGRLYARDVDISDPLASPGCCADKEWWRRAIPEKEVVCFYGREEMLYDGICRLMDVLEMAVGEGKVVRVVEDAMHVWPVAVGFLGMGREEREGPGRRVAESIWRGMRGKE